jgi:hypothetical protein
MKGLKEYRSKWSGLWEKKCGSPGWGGVVWAKGKQLTAAAPGAPFRCRGLGVLSYEVEARPKRRPDPGFRR